MNADWHSTLHTSLTHQLTRRPLVLLCANWLRPAQPALPGFSWDDHAAAFHLDYAQRERLPQMEQALTPQDLLATVYRHLHIDPTQTLTDFAGRPVHILPSGKPIEQLI